MNTDEEYLIGQVLNSSKTDGAAAKSWMIFSKSAYPQSFQVLFQSYKMECEEKNLNDSAQCLGELVKKFPNEMVLVKELRNIAKVLCSENNEFAKQIFDKLPEDVKYEVMLAVTRNAQTVEEHCELMLLFLKRMPSSRLATHGKNIIDTLLGAEERSGTNSPINMFRKMLVCDALPLILRGSQFEYMYKIVIQLLQKAIEFYVSCMFSPSAQGTSIWKDVMSHVDGDHEDGFKPLLKLLETIAIRNRWSYPEMFVSNFSDLSLQQLLALLKKKNKTLSSLTNEKHRREEMSGYDEAYFCLVVTFFFYLYNFGKQIMSKTVTNSTLSPYNYILMEGVSLPQIDCPKTMGSEFKRTERGFMVVSRMASPESANMIVPSFTTAVECWDLLHRHQLLMKEFKILCQNIQMETWPAFQEFYISMLIYERAHTEAIDHLNQIRDRSSEITVKNKTALQIASCYHFLGEQEHCLKLLFEVVMNLMPSMSSVVKPPVSKCASRFLYFMGYNNKEILQYCVSLLLKLFKCKERVDISFKNENMGFMLVLMQYDLDHEYDLLHRCIDTIKKNKNFSFQKFFNYIINVDILEEISYLASPAGGNVNLEILSTPTFQASKQRAITRGVNKGARDDLKQAFMNQMTRCYDNLDNLFIEFIKEEHEYVLLSLIGWL